MRKLLLSKETGIVFESTQAGARRRGSTVRRLFVHCLDVPDRVDVSGGVCRHSQTRTPTQMDALCDGVVLACTVAEPLRKSDSWVAGGAGWLEVVSAGGCHTGSLFPESTKRSPGILSECLSGLHRRTESRGTTVFRAGTADRSESLSGSVCAGWL